MTWLSSLREQLPLLLVLSPAIGFVVSILATRIERDLVRHLAISNSVCTLIVLGGAILQFAIESTNEVTASATAGDLSGDDPSESSVDIARQSRERTRVERISRHWFALDGTNLWPTILIVVMSTLVIWQFHPQTGPLSWFIPITQLFAATSLASLTSYDIRVFLICSGVSSLVMSLLIGHWGAADRRNIASRFLFAQFCGYSFIMLGFAMLVAVVPWMKIEASPSLPRHSYHIATIVYEIQRWTTGHEPSFQYGTEVLPWTMFTISLGFAMTFGLFPFHSPQIAILSRVPSAVAVLYAAGSLSVCVAGWLRFVVPIAPDLLAGFDGLILVPAIGGSIWGAIRALASGSPLQRGAFAFLSISGVSLLGCYSLTRPSMCGAWLMQQQLIVVYCAIRQLIDAPDFVMESGRSASVPRRPLLKTRTLLLLVCLPVLGFFASSSMFLPDLLRESLLLVGIIFFVGLSISITIYLLLTRRGQSSDDAVSFAQGRIRDQAGLGLPRMMQPNSGGSGSNVSTSVLAPTELTQFRVSILVVGVLAVVVNLAPQLMLSQCEPEFARVFRRFERISVDEKE